MFWMRNKENNFPIRTLIWRPALITIAYSVMTIIISAIFAFSVMTNAFSVITIAFFFLVGVVLIHLMTFSFSVLTVIFSVMTIAFFFLVGV